MSSKREDKEQRRQERLAAEEAAKRAAERRDRLRYVGGGLLALAILAAVVVLISGTGSEGDGADAGTRAANVELPPSQTDNLAEAARAAGCRVSSPKVAGSEHVSEPVSYKTNPPTSGDHDPVPAEDGVYEPGSPPDLEQSVHALEHGRILVQYAPGTERRRIDQLNALFSEEVQGEGGYHTLLFENQSKMSGAVAATAWGQSLICSQFNDQVFDAVRAFRNQHVDKGPEFIP